MKIIERGSRGKISQYLNESKDIIVELLVDGQAVYVSCCLGLDAKGKLSDDRYMVFFNQTSSPNQEIVLNSGGEKSSYTFNLSRLPAQIDKLAFTISVDGEGVLSQVKRLTVALIEKKGELASFFSAKEPAVSLELTGADFANEKALIVLEIYREAGWRFAAVASGFNGGLAALLSHYGGQALEVPSPPSVVSKLSLEKRLEKKAPELVSLAKPLKLVLEKKKLSDTVAKVALVLDISDSMVNKYEDGAVQAVVNKTVPLAVQFDDDGELALWYFGSIPQKRPSINLDNYQNAAPKDWRSLMSILGGGNLEPLVMREVINEYSGGQLPAYVLFITDGWIYEEEQIRKLLIWSSHLPIFWQFVGLGVSKYGILEHFDFMKGRYADNINFFALDDFREIEDAALYNRLLGEFSAWMKEAKKKKIL
jgi:stress response protein SCP2